MNTITTKSESGSLDVLAADINRYHAAAEQALRSGLENARQAGELLLEAKGKLPHGEWYPWLKRNCKFSARTAQAYMRVAKRWPELDSKCATSADLTFREATQLLCAPAVEGEAEEQLPDGPFRNLLQLRETFLTIVRAMVNEMLQFTDRLDSLTADNIPELVAHLEEIEIVQDAHDALNARFAAWQLAIHRCDQNEREMSLDEIRGHMEDILRCMLRGHERMMGCRLLLPECLRT